ncbi:hypothetical protein LXL04_017176 [Taraxacum kok-saghyz]
MVKSEAGGGSSGSGGDSGKDEQHTAVLVSSLPLFCIPISLWYLALHFTFFFVDPSHEFGIRQRIHEQHTADATGGPILRRSWCDSKKRFRLTTGAPNFRIEFAQGVRRKTQMEVNMLVRDPQICQSINQNHCNGKHFPDHKLPENVIATTDAKTAFSNADFCLQPSMMYQYRSLGSVLLGKTATKGIFGKVSLFGAAWETCFCIGIWGCCGICQILTAEGSFAELRDGDKGTYLGNGVTRAVKNVNEKISEAIVGMDPTLQVPLYKHIADLSGRGNHVLPIPAFTLINGGKHAGNNLALRDIIVLPIGAKRFKEAMQMGSETYHHLKAVITEKFGAQGCNVGEDGGFAPNMSRHESCILLLI